MRKILLITFFVTSLLLKPAFSQYRITLDSLNTYHYMDINTYGGQSSFLIDIPIKGKIDTLFINDRMRIPLDAFLNFIPPVNVKLLIVAKKRKKGYHNDTKEYLIRNRYAIDSLNNIDGTLFRYKELPVYKPNKDFLLIYYTEATGSVCCPRDPKYDMQSLSAFIRQFENANKVKINVLYTENVGKEGEHIEYLTLEGLTALQKIKFIDERVWNLIPNKELKDFGKVYTIYFPTLVAMKYLKKAD